jgi:hypothetical protein
MKSILKKQTDLFKIIILIFLCFYISSCSFINRIIGYPKYPKNDPVVETPKRSDSHHTKIPIEEPQVKINKRIQPIKGKVFCKGGDILKRFSLRIMPDNKRLTTDDNGIFEWSNNRTPPNKISFSDLYNSNNIPMVNVKEDTDLLADGTWHLVVKNQGVDVIIRETVKDALLLPLKMAELRIKSIDNPFKTNEYGKTEILPITYSHLLNRNNLEVTQGNKKFKILHVDPPNDDYNCSSSFTVIVNYEEPSQIFEEPVVYTVEGFIYIENSTIPVSDVKIYYNYSNNYVFSKIDGSFIISLPDRFDITKLEYKGEEYRVEKNDIEYKNNKRIIYLPRELQDIYFIVKYGNNDQKDKKDQQVVPYAQIEFDSSGTYFVTDDKGEYHWQGRTDIIPKPTNVHIDGKTININDNNIDNNTDKNTYNIIVPFPDIISASEKDICDQIKIDFVERIDDKNNNNNQYFIVLKNEEGIYGYHLKEEGIVWDHSYQSFRKERMLPKYIHSDDLSKYFCILHKNKKSIQILNKSNKELRASIKLPQPINQNSLVYKENRDDLLTEPEIIISFTFEKNSSINLLSSNNQKCKVYNMSDSKEMIYSNIAIYEKNYAFVSTRLNGQSVIHKININDDTIQKFDIDVIIKKIAIQEDRKKLILVSEKGNILISDPELNNIKSITKFKKKGIIDNSFLVFRDYDGKDYCGGLFSLNNHDGTTIDYEWRLYSLSGTRSFWCANDSIKLNINQSLPYFTGAISTRKKLYAFFIQGNELLSFSRDIKNRKRNEGIGQWSMEKKVLLNESTGISIYHPFRTQYGGGLIVVKMIEMKGKTFNQVFTVDNKGLNPLNFKY